jgi:tRNA-2-methylthio-N6-dimethylallyladenosine synthase
MSELKRKKPGLIIGVVGCLAQQKGHELLDRFPQVDLVMGPREIGRIKEILGQIYADGEKIVATHLEPGPPHPVPCQGYFDGRVTGTLSIMEGCNNFCSYCIVPYVRGREISRSPQEIVIEAKNLISEGVKDITLLGQNVNSYRWEGMEKWNFVTLLREITRLDGLLRLRFTTSHPKDLSEQLIQCFGDLDKLCPHIHLPFQAGSNSVLDRMKRGYTREKYIELIDKLRAVRSDIAITSDVMVGFPGENEQDFDMTLNLIKRVQFDSLFSFKYSDRKGTVAAKMGDKVGETDKSLRLSVLQNLQKKISLKKNRALEGKQLEVLVEGYSKKGGQISGRTGSNKIMNFTSNNNLIGRLVVVTVNCGLLNSLQGEMAPEE